MDRNIYLNKPRTSFRLFVASMRDLETGIIESSIDNIFDWTNGHDEASLCDASDRRSAQMNLKALSVLTSSGTYHDVRNSVFNQSTFDPELATRINEKFSEEFDGKLSYRLVEALRNHAKHHGFALEGYSYGPCGQWKGKPGKGYWRRRETLGLYVSTSSLMNNRRIRSATRRELSEIKNPKVCAKSLLRNYPGSMALGNNALRELTESSYQNATKVIDFAHTKFLSETSDVSDDEAKFLSLTNRGSNAEKPMHLGKIFYRKLARARRRFSRLDGFEILYVSSEMTKGADVFHCDAEDVFIS